MALLSGLASRPPSTPGRQFSKNVWALPETMDSKKTIPRTPHTTPAGGRAPRDQAQEDAQEAQEAEAAHTTPAGGARRGTGAQSLTKEKKEKGRPGAREGAAGGASPQHPRIAPMAARHSWISRQ